MMNNQTNNTNYYNQRDNRGRFTSVSTRRNNRTMNSQSSNSEMSQNNRTTNSQSSNSSISQTLKRDSRGRFTSVQATQNSSIRSSFVESMVIDESLVHVVMRKRPHITYVYKPTSAGLRTVQKTLKSCGSLGTVYNSYLKGREVFRVIYKV
jgi:hypothetical protein